MSTNPRERLYGLLPAIYRVRDHQRGEPLRALLGVIETEFDRVEEDIEGLYDNWFIETCEEWVVPYIGELLNVRPIRSVESARLSLRGYVANTLAYRRRKGTAMVLEQLARDTTGWAARAVEFFERLATTQHLNHVRLSRPATVAVRDAASAALVDSAFDPAAHFADVRSIALRRGRHNIPNVGLFLWRLQSYPIGSVGIGGKVNDLVTARKEESGAFFTFSPLGLKVPLFNPPRTEETIAHLAEEHNVPGILRGPELRRELDSLRRVVRSPAAERRAAPRRFMTPDKPALRVYVGTAHNPVPVPQEDIYICDIPDAASPPRLAVAIDPERGRLAFPPALQPSEAFVTFSYGFSGDLGGGPYDRYPTVDDAFRSPDWQAGVAHLSYEPGISGTIHGNLASAVAEWHAQPAETCGVIAIMDSVTEAGPAGSALPDLEIRVPKGSQLLIVAAGWPLQDAPGSSGARERRRGVFDARGVRPHYVGKLVFKGTAPTDSAARGSVVLNGLLVEGAVTVADGNLGRLEISHGTVVPPRNGISVPTGNGRLELVLRRSIVGPVAIPNAIHGLSLTDCIVDAGASGVPAVDALRSPLAMERCTVFGNCRAKWVEVSNTIFTATLQAERRQQGCVRFSFVRHGSLAPKKYCCQPDMEIQRQLARAAETARKAGRVPGENERAFIRAQVIAALEPMFTSAAYGDPGYAQLELSCPAPIREGAEDGSEMGAFSFLMQPQREQNLRTALEEYLRLGLEAGLIYVN